MKALLLGSIGVVVDSSALQLEAYNAAFADEGLDWHWSADDYRALLSHIGGRERLDAFAAIRSGRDDQGGHAGQGGQGGQAAAGQGGPSARVPDARILDRVHATKTRLFDEWLFEGRAQARPGVRRLLDEATAAGVRTGFVTSTELGNVRATLEAAGDGVRLERFDVFTHRGTVDAPKPDVAPWRKALAELGLEPSDAVAVEDTVECADSAVDAGLVCIATPNSFAAHRTFPRAAATVDALGDVDVPATLLAGVDIVEDGLVTLERLASLLRR